MDANTYSYRFFNSNSSATSDIDRYTSGYRDGYRDRYANGYRDGYRDGYAAAQRDANQAANADTHPASDRSGPDVLSIPNG
jgi:flagellar biosynthesis/type III secretory pathway protein FliH